MRRAWLALAALGCGHAADPAQSCQAPSWQAVTTTLNRAALAGWCAEDGTTWIVGGGLGVPGAGALLLRWDGTAWEDVPTGRSETLWWIWGTPDGHDVWTVGEQGLVLHDQAPVPSGTDAPLYGVWGAAPDDVWIVGGTPGGGPGVVLHWDGTRLSPVDVSARRAALFKVWGSAKDDVWVTGEGGTLFHLTAAGWEDRSSDLGTLDALTTVNGCAADDVWTVGGQDVFHFDGKSWQKTDAPVLSVATGVACSPDTVLVVGAGGLRLRLDRKTGTWTDDTLDGPWDTDYHGALIGDGMMWALGGDYVAPASSIQTRDGVVATYACQAPPSP